MLRCQMQEMRRVHRGAGECNEGIKPTVATLQANGIGTIMAFAAEDDICASVCSTSFICSKFPDCLETLVNQ